MTILLKIIYYKKVEKLFDVNMISIVDVTSLNKCMYE